VRFHKLYKCIKFDYNRRFFESYAREIPWTPAQILMWSGDTGFDRSRRDRAYQTPPRHLHVVLSFDVFPSLWPELEPEALSSGPRTPIFARPFLIRASHAGGNLPVVRKPRNTSPHGYPSPFAPQIRDHVPELGRLLGQRNNLG
jgi:hypothetical protein